MMKPVCDFCGEIIDDTSFMFKENGREKCRFVIEKIEIHSGRRGVRWKHKYYHIARKNKRLCGD